MMYDIQDIIGIVLAGLTTVIAMVVLVSVRALEKLRPGKKEGESL